MKFFICLIIFSVYFSEASETKVTWFLSPEPSAHKVAIVPSYRRSETLGSIVSGRIFIYPTAEQGLYTSLSVDLGLDLLQEIYGVKQNTIYWWSQNEWHLSSEWTSTWDSYYGDKTVQTRLEIPVKKRWVQSSFINKSLLRKIHPQLQIGVSFEVQNRLMNKNQPCMAIKKDNKPRPVELPCGHYNDEELGGTVGGLLRMDTRDNSFDPSSGYFIQADFKAGKEFVATNNITFQVEAQAQFIFSLIEKERWFIKLASGWNFPREIELPYIFQYHLGGVDQLRGYLKDRWNDSQYYLVQMELRYPVYPWLQPLLFTDIGHVEIDHQPLITYGAGVRIGLPPSFEQKIRVEYGRSKDQSNFIISFAHPY